MEYIKVSSWHIIRTWTRVPNRAITVCGRTVTGRGSDTLPLDQKSCESCLRLSAKGREDDGQS